MQGDMFFNRALTVRGASKRNAALRQSLPSKKRGGSKTTISANTHASVFSPFTPNGKKARSAMKQSKFADADEIVS